MNTSTAIAELRTSSDECIDNGAAIKIPEAGFRLADDCRGSNGEGIPQGDIMLVAIPEIPSGAVEIEAAGDKQLAEGNSKGSRHVIPGRFAVNLFRVNDGDDLSDLCVVAEAPFDLEHPEHADHIGYPAGWYRVRHQQNAQRERVRD